MLPPAPGLPVVPAAGQWPLPWGRVVRGAARFPGVGGRDASPNLLPRGAVAPTMPVAPGGVWGPGVTTAGMLFPSHPAEAAAGAHHLHPLAAGRAGGTLRQDPVP